MPADRFSWVLDQAAFFQARYHFIVKLGVVLTLLNIIGTLFITAYLETKPPPPYYISTTVGQLMAVEPVFER